MKKVIRNQLFQALPSALFLFILFIFISNLRQNSSTYKSLFSIYELQLFAAQWQKKAHVNDRGFILSESCVKLFLIQPDADVHRLTLQWNPKGKVHSQNTQMTDSTPLLRATIIDLTCHFPDRLPSISFTSPSLLN